MAISLKNPDADRLARELAEVTGESLTDAITNSIRERLDRERRRRGTKDRIRRLVEEVAVFPVMDSRSTDEILRYDNRGLPV